MTNSGNIRTLQRWYRGDPAERLLADVIGGCNDRDDGPMQHCVAFRAAMTHRGPMNKVDQFSRRTVMSTAGAVLTAVSVTRPASAATPAGDPVLVDARAHGVIGDGRADDTRAVQAVLDLCTRQRGRIAYFGTMTVRITGPLTSRDVGIVFEPASYGGAGAPGFVAAGQGYTALTVVGSVADFCVTVSGADGADISDAGRIDADRRPRINGIAFGTDTEPFAMSTVRWVRAVNLAGCGIRHAQCWDSTFLSVSVERCGRDDVYAFEVAGDARRSCNETTWTRIQVEQSIGASMRIDPGTLSCTFAKIHSERAIARGRLSTWLFGGSCIYDSVRLTAANPAVAGLTIISNQSDFRNLRAEEGICVTVDASDGVVNFHNPGAIFQPAPDQSGIVNIFGGSVSVIGIGGGWNLVGCRVARLEVGFMPYALRAVLTGCRVDELVPAAGTDQGELVLNATRVEAAILAAPAGGRLRALHLGEASQLVAKGSTLTCTDQSIFVDPTSRITGHVVLERVALRLAGTITGDLTVRGPVHDARALDGATVGGRVIGWGAPSVAGSPGAWSVNLAAGGSGASPVLGWRYAAGAWRPVRIEIKG